MDLSAKREQEKEIMTEMVALYCRGRHGTVKGELCASCRKLLLYAHQRTSRCPHMADKTFCSNCPSPCYKPGERDQVRAVMRYAGPRMLFHRPLLVLRHMLPQGKAGVAVKKGRETS